MPFTHEIHEEPIERRESWRAEIAGYLVEVDRRDDGHTEVRISATGPDRRPCPVVRCYPKHVDELDRVADVLPELLKAAVTELRAAGLVDLRSRMEVMIDEQRAKIDEQCAKFDEQRARIDAVSRQVRE